MAAPRIVVVIPALDEEEAIGAVVREIPPIVHEVIVVDNGSRDRTPEAARAAGARVVSEPRRGYGHACLAGIAAAGDADVFVFLDGDHSDYPAQLVDVVAPILEGRADLVIGSRSRGRREAGAHPWHAVLGTRACVGLMNLLAGSRATDLGPFRAITAEALQRLDMRDRNYGWTVEMQVKAARQGLRVVEVPVDYRPRIGRSKVSGTVRGTVGAGTKIIATILRHAFAPRSVVIPRDFDWTGPEESAVPAGPALAPGRRPRAHGVRARVGVGPSAPEQDRPAPGALRPGVRRLPRGPRRLARALAPRVAALPGRGRSLAGRARGRAAPPEQRHQPLRLGGARPGPRREPVPLERPTRVAAVAAAARQRLRGAQPQGLHGGLPAAVPPRHARGRGRARLVHRDEGVPRRVRARDTRRPRPPAAPPAPPARAPPRARLEPSRPRRDRRQRAQRRLRPDVDGARPPRPGYRSAAPLRPGRRSRGRLEVPARPRGRRAGRAATGGGTSSPPSPSPGVSSSPTSTRRRRRRCS